MGKLTKGIEERRGAFGFGTAAPLDDRAVVKNLASLIGLDTWTTIKYLYVGLQTIVQSTKEIYICKVDGANYTSAQEAAFLPKTTKTDDITDAVARSTYQDQINLCWEKVPSSSDIKGLSGVFQFKGVANSINQAQTILTLNSAKATKGGKTHPVNCQTIGYEYDMDIYYGWGETADSILFWTDTPNLTSTSTQYGVTTPTAVKKLVLNGEDYYIADRTVPAGDGLSQWENISGKVVYCNETTSKVYSEDQEDPEYELGVAEIVTYEAYDFAPLVASDKYTVSNIASAAVAAEGNAGHVYQIGENEYASNGTIWVKLGSPVEDWVIL